MNFATTTSLINLEVCHSRLPRRPSGMIRFGKRLVDKHTCGCSFFGVSAKAKRCTFASSQRFHAWMVYSRVVLGTWFCMLPVSTSERRFGGCWLMGWMISAVTVELAMGTTYLVLVYLTLNLLDIHCSGLLIHVWLLYFALSTSVWAHYWMIKINVISM